jgi:molybdate transport system permease protein
MSTIGVKLAKSATKSIAHRVALVHALVLFVLLVLPLFGLVLATTPSDLLASVTTPAFGAAMWLSAYTTLLSVVFTVLTGTPLAWWIAVRKTSIARLAGVLVELPIVVPPAVVGVALLYTFGRRGLLGDVLGSVGVSLPFTTTAVVLAQVVVSAPFYVQAATSTFRSVPEDLLVVARTLGASPTYTFFRVTLPLAKSGLVAGISLAWARALGEFGATLLFAGSFQGVSRTMPLAIYSAMESDTRVAVALSLTLASIGTLLLFVLRTPRVSHVAQQVYA